MPEDSIQYQHVVEDQMELERKNTALTEVLEHIEQQKMQIKKITNKMDNLNTFLQGLKRQKSPFT